MADIRFGFVGFEVCFHCNRVRSFFTPDTTPVQADEYREGNCTWSRVENAQSFRFALRCTRCGERHSFDELMGLLYCTACDPECRVELLRRQAESEGLWALVGFGFIEDNRPALVAAEKLDLVADYFNQRRDPARPRLRLLPAHQIGDVSRCRGEFLHDVGMLSREPPPARRSPFEVRGTG